MKIARWIEAAFRFFFNDRVKSVFEQVVLVLAASGFLLHLSLILLNDFNIIQLRALPGGLLGSPISAIYTPFSFILIYEVYLLVYYLPASFTTSIAKQFEIISLIKIRAIFKDISKLKLDENWFRHRSDIVFMVDIVGFLILFYLIFWFYKLKRDRPKPEPPRDIHEFILWKKLICSVLIIILAALSIYSFVHWVGQVQAASIAAIGEVTSINNIFYDEFFSVLILVDVFLLIVSFKYTERYSQLIRNSGFIISTILIRLSFNSADFVDMGLIITGVLFGVLILRIYNSLAAVEAE